MPVQLLAQADDAFRRSRWQRAIAAYAGVVRAVPLHTRARLRLADALLNGGHRDAAVRVYAAVAEHAFSMGQPLIGLIATKMHELVAPDAEDSGARFAELYSNDVGGERPELNRSTTPKATVSAAALPEDAALIDAAVHAATHWPHSQAPGSLPRVPLLSQLSEDDVLLLLDKITLRRFSAEQPIIRQGERAESFFWLADGHACVKRDIADDGGVVLGHLHDGSLFGEMALLSDEPRHAAVLAETDVDVLELRVADLIVASSHSPSLRDAVREFTRERFLHNLMATHPFFGGLARASRHAVAERFSVAAFEAGETIIPQGDSGPGLFLLLVGAAAVAKDREGERIFLASLKAGEFCGEMSLIADQPTMATVTATERTEALFLPRESFKALTREHPQLFAYLASLSDERLRHNRSLLGGGLLDDDEHVLL
jgi:cAMP-dependent protein kinase regulator